MADVYGAQEQFDGAVDAVKAQIDALVTAMATGYAPALSYSYKGHNQIPITFYGATTALDSVETEEIGKASGCVLIYRVKVTVRVHTKYVGRYTDTTIIGQLLNSMDNYLNTHRNMSATYVMLNTESHRIGVSFSESGTIGGELTAVVKTIIEHLQA